MVSPSSPIRRPRRRQTRPPTSMSPGSAARTRLRERRPSPTSRFRTRSTRTRRRPSTPQAPATGGSNRPVPTEHPQRRGRSGATSVLPAPRRVERVMLPARLLAALAVCAIALAACGSSHGPSSTTGSGTSSPAIEFADCMRAHGVPSFPDPNGGGGPTSVADTGTPAFKSASRACARLAPGGSRGVRSTESQFLAALRFAKCVRTHGVPGMPDPTRGSGPVPAGLGLGHGLYFPVSPSFDPNAPAVLRAAATCGIAKWEGGP